MTAIHTSNVALESTTFHTLSPTADDFQEQNTSRSTCIYTGNPEIDDRLQHVVEKLSYLTDKQISYHDGTIHISITTTWTPKDQLEKLKESIPQETNLDVEIQWEVDNPNAPSPQEKALREQRRVSHNKVINLIKGTIPKGVHIQKVVVAPQKIGNRNSAYPFAVIHVASSDIPEQVLTDWQESLIQDHNTCTHLMKTHTSQSPAAQLKRYADSDGILRSWDDIPSFDILVNSMKQPELTERHLNVRPNGKVKDFRRVPFLTIDGPECDDPEDMMYARRLSNGNTELVFGLSYVAPIIQNSAEDIEYLMRCGDSIFGKEVTLHNIGDIYKASALMPDKKRYILAIRSELSAEKGIVRSDFCQAVAINRRQLTKHDVEEMHGDGVVSSLFDASKILYAHRLGIETDRSHFSPESEDLVREICLHAYNQMTFAMQQKGAPLFYRIHSTPNRTRLKSIRAKIRALGYSRGMQNLNYSDSLYETIQTLGQDGHYTLVREIVDTYLTRGRYSEKRWSHFDLNFDYYGPWKFRKLPSAINQFQAHNSFSKGRLLSQAQLQKLQPYINRQSKKNRRKAFRLSVLEEMQQELSSRGSTQRATVIQSESGTLPIIDLPGIYNKSVLLSSPAGYRNGQEVAVQIEGIDTSNGRFLYRPAA